MLVIGIPLLRKMEVTESIESINNQLIAHFGIDSLSGIPIWRIVWSEDQFEHRLGTFDDISPAGLYLRTVTEVRLVPKYRQWIHNKYILERLVVIPDYQQVELPKAKISYEPIWTFENAKGDALPPKWEACKFIIDTIYAAQYSNHSLARYTDPDNSQEAVIENQQKRVDKIVEELFGEDSGLTGLKTRESIIVP